MGNPSERLEHNLRQRVLRICDDCNQEYDATGQTVIERFASSAKRFLCPQCRKGLLKERELQFESQRLESLAYMRDEQCKKVIPPKFAAERLHTFDPTGNERSFERIFEYVDKFPDGLPRGYDSLYISSQNNGVGKTHLACAITHELIQRLKEHRQVSPYQFIEAIRLKIAIHRGQAFGAKRSAEDIYEDAFSYWLLVLDDVGKEKLTPADAAFAFEIYYTIINERYNRCLPLIITSNLPFQEPWVAGGMTLQDLIGPAAVSRLREMCRGEIIVIQGEDRR